MEEMVAFCGIVCTECPTYQATQKNDNKARAKIAKDWSKRYKHDFRTEDINCDGCLAVGKRQVGYCMACEIRKCGSDKKVVNCGYCVEYPCDKLSNFQTLVPAARPDLRPSGTQDSSICE
jgi:hypothetical protein